MNNSNQHFSENADQQVPPTRKVYAPPSLLPTVLSRLGLEHPTQQREEQVDDLPVALQSDQWDTRAAAVRKLGKLGEQAPLEPLMAALDDEHGVVRANAIHALAKLGERVPVERLIATLSDSDWRVREAAVFALGTLGERVPREPLLAALDDSDASVREAARLALNGLQSALPTASPGATPVSAEAPAEELTTSQFNSQAESSVKPDDTFVPSADQKQGTPGTAMPVSLLHRLRLQRERPHSMNTDRKDVQPQIQRRKPLQRVVGMLATVALLILLAGSIVIVLNLAHQRNGKQGSSKIASPTTAISPTAPPTIGTTPTPIDTRPQNLYLVHDSTIFKMDARTRVVLWSYTIKDGSSPSSPHYFREPTVVDGIVYVLPAPQTSTIYALDANKGTFLWKFTTKVPGSMPTIAGGRMYVSAVDYRGVNSGIYVLNAKTGAVVHFYQTSDNPGLLTVLNGVLYTVGSAGDGGGYVDAINIVDGSQKFRIPLPSHGQDQKYGDVVAINGILFMISSADSPGNPSYVYALNAQTGAQLWHSEEINGPLDDQRALDGITGLQVVNGILYFDNPYGFVYALNIATGSTLWKHEIGDGNTPAISDPVVVSNDVVYVAADLSDSPGASSQCPSTASQATQTYILALGSRDGVPLWCYAMEQSNVTFAVIKQVVYAGYIIETQTGYQTGLTTGMLQALNATTGSKLWQETLWHTRESGVSTGDAPLPIIAAP